MFDTIVRHKGKRTFRNKTIKIHFLTLQRVISIFSTILNISFIYLNWFSSGAYDVHQLTGCIVLYRAVAIL